MPGRIARTIRHVPGRDKHRLFVIGMQDHVDVRLRDSGSSADFDVRRLFGIVGADIPHGKQASSNFSCPPLTRAHFYVLIFRDLLEKFHLELP